MNPFIGEIRMFAGPFAPKDWAFCAGQLVPVQQNTALFSILGTTYGGNGTTNFALPNLQGRIPMHFSDSQSPGPGLGIYPLGDQGGATTVTLQSSEMPAHGHGFSVTDVEGNAPPSANTVLAPAGLGGLQGGASVNMYSDSAANVQLTTPVLGSAGGGQAHNNMMPFLAVSYIIALQGVFPQRP